MNTALLISFAIILVIAAALLKRTKANSRVGGISKRHVLTPREQAMYFRLVEALNGHVVLGQVAFSAMIKAKSRATRNRFDRKVADFVILNKAFEVLAVVELDDASHKNRETQDRERQALLTNAGYRVIRYSNVPNVEQVHKDFHMTEIGPRAIGRGNITQAL